MKKLDTLILKEIIGPWVFGVAIFTVLIMAGSFLFEFTRLLSQQADPLKVLSLAGLLMPGIMVKTFSMAMLLATLLAFGRLSGDSEIVAMRAAGVGVGRIVLPVGFFGAAVAVIAFFAGNYLVPNASLRAVTIRTEIEKELEGRSERATFHPIARDGKTVAFINARDFSIESQTLTGVIINYLGNDGKVTYVLEAERMKYLSEDDWEIVGGATLHAVKTGQTIVADRVWPDQIEKPQFRPEDLLANSLKDMDVLSMDQLKEQQRKELAKENPDRAKAINFEFGYWNKITLPLAALVFGILGAPLGIRNHRSGKAVGFWLSVIIIFGYMMLTNVMSIMAQGERIPVWAASFTPVLIGLVFGMVLIHRRNG